MNQQEAGKLLRILRTVWPEAAINADTVTAWGWAFEGVPYALAESAAKQWIRTGTFFPRPGELLRSVAAAVVGPALVPELAWGEVLAEVRRVGFNRLPVFHAGQFEPAPAPTFSHPLIAEAVDAVGWATICTTDKPEVLRSQFVKTLDVLRERAIKQVQVGPDLAALAASKVGALDGSDVRLVPDVE